MTFEERVRNRAQPYITAYENSVYFKLSILVCGQVFMIALLLIIFPTDTKIAINIAEFLPVEIASICGYAMLDYIYKKLGGTSVTKTSKA